MREKKPYFIIGDGTYGTPALAVRDQKTVETPDIPRIPFLYSPCSVASFLQFFSFSVLLFLHSSSEPIKVSIKKPTFLLPDSCDLDSRVVLNSSAKP